VICGSRLPPIERLKHRNDEDHEEIAPWSRWDHIDDLSTRSNLDGRCRDGNGAADPSSGERSGEKDGTAIGLLDAAGHVVEVTETPRGARPVGTVRGPLQPTQGLAWDELGQRWTIAGGAGAPIPIDPP
jgi:hypothetical protein